MLLVRWSLLRRIYVYHLNLMTRIAYQTNLRRDPRSIQDPHIQKIRRINSELEFGPGAWESSLWENKSPCDKYNPQNASFTAPSDSGYHLEDITTCVVDGVDAIVGDSLTKCFTSEPSEPWNFLTRNVPATQRRLPPYLTLIWLIGIWTRYCILLPFRVTVLFLGFLTFGIAYPLVELLFPKGKLQNAMKKWLLRYLASVFVASWSGFIRYHGKRPQRRENQIYVANHTSLIDLFVLSKDHNFSVIGQRHRGVAGMFQDLLLTTQNHVWFDREHEHERRRVQSMLKEHVMNGENEPMLVFPEDDLANQSSLCYMILALPGTCTNTEYCIMFKKGSFELGATVYPIALRYRKEFGDAFWNSMQGSFVCHLFDLMTSWSIFCDVYYMEPQTIRPGETSTQFAARVQEMICQRACLTKVNWNGFLKRRRISPRFLEQRQKAFAAVVNRRLNGHINRSRSTSMLQKMDIKHDSSSIAEKRLHIASAASQSGMNYLRSRNTKRGGLNRKHGEPPVARVFHRTVTVATNAAQATVRWGIALGLLTIITVISVRMTPTSWKRLVADCAFRIKIPSSISG